MIALAAWIAEQEHQHVSERTCAGLVKARRAGRCPSARTAMQSQANVE